MKNIDKLIDFLSNNHIIIQKENYETINLKQLNFYYSIKETEDEDFNKQLILLHDKRLATISRRKNIKIYGSSNLISY